MNAVPDHAEHIFEGGVCPVLSTIDLRGRVPSTAELRRALPRGAADVDSMLPTVRPVVGTSRPTAPRRRCATRRSSTRAAGLAGRPAEVIADALAGLDADVRAALEESIGRIRKFHEARSSDVSVGVVPGGVVKEKWIPIRRVGLYVPGGNAVYRRPCS